METKNLMIRPVPLGMPATAAGARADKEGVAIECHRNQVPASIEEELDRLYGSLFCSLAHFRVYGGMENATTYVARIGGKAIAIFLFRIEGGVARVVNEWMPLDDTEASRFANWIFAHYRSVGAIVFGAVAAAVARPPYPFRRVEVTDDSVLTLPSSDQEFLASLGKSTRTNIRYYLNKLKKDHPSFSFTVRPGSEASEHDMREIVRFNRIRMRIKNKVSANEGEALDRILRLARTSGLVGVAMIDGRVCAGVIGYRIGNHFFSWVRAHDPDFDGYRLGRLAGYLMIGEAIRRGIREYHFLWGREEHKAMLQGVERRFDRVVLYRSRAHIVRHMATTWNTARIGWNRRLRLWFEGARQRDDGMSRLTVRMLEAVRDAKRFVTGKRR